MRKVISRFGVARAMCILGICLIPVVTVMAVTWPTGDPFLHTEANGCAVCHIPDGSGTHMEPIVESFVDSGHAYASAGQGSNQNTYCAKCHSPFQADPEATGGDNDPVPSGAWEAVTCGVCHPSHTLRVQWGTPIATYDIESGEYTPVYDSNELCEHCHEGSRHAKDFQGFGQSMFTKKLVTCVDCHMARMPELAGDEGEDRPTRRASHSFGVAENLPYSCGIGDDNCHANKTVKWAVKQIEKMIIHANKVKKEKSNEGNHGDQK